MGKTKRTALIIVVAAALLLVAAFFLLIMPALRAQPIGARSGDSAYGPYSFQAYGENGQNAADQAVVRMQQIEYRVQGALDGDVERINQNAGNMLVCDPSTIFLVERAVHYNEVSLQRFSVLDGLAKQAWGFGGGEPDAEAIAALRHNPSMAGVYVDFTQDQIGIDADVRMDLAPLLPGYCVDQAASIARDYGVTRGFFQMGDMAVALGKRAGGGHWSYSIPHPTQDRQTLGVLLLEEQACATVGIFSGTVSDLEGNARAAVIDPWTNAPADSDVISATVVANSAMEASALANAILVSGRDEGEAMLNQAAGASAVLVMRDGGVWCSPSLRSYFSIRTDEYRLLY